MLDADRQAHITFGHAGLLLLVGRQLRMRSRRREDGKRAYIADIGDVVDHLQRVDEALARRAAAFQLETEKAAIAALEVGLAPALRFRVLVRAGEDDARHLG